MRVVSKLEADDWVARKAQTPVRQEEINGSKLGKIECAIAPAIRVLGFGTVVTVAQIVNRDPVSVDFSPGGSISIGLPRSTV